MARRTILIGIIISLFVIAFAVPGYCDDPIRKLGRGICNVTTFPLEMVKQTSDIANSDGPMAGATYGVLRGIGMMGARIIVGVYEIATFLVPVPPEYKPILTDPEFFLEEKNW